MSESKVAQLQLKIISESYFSMWITGLRSQQGFFVCFFVVVFLTIDSTIIPATIALHY